MPLVFPIHCLGSISYYAALLQNEAIIDIHENYVKRSFRNRFDILGANGRMSLSFPVKSRSGLPTPMNSILLDNESRWKRSNWRSVQSAYGSSPFYDYYFEELEDIFNKEHELLLNFNLELLDYFCSILNFTKSTQFSQSYLEVDFANDLRKSGFDFSDNQEKYLQVFSDRMPFEPNLSIVDLIMNKGPESGSYLLKMDLTPMI